MRKFAVKSLKVTIATLCIGACTALPSAVALTLGNIASQSSLGQPLRLVIPVTLNGGENLSNACLRLVADAQAGDTPQLVTGKVSFEPGTPTSRVVVSTARPMNEPALKVSVQTGCGDTARRDYVLLFDPPAADQTLAPATIVADVTVVNMPIESNRPALNVNAQRAPHMANAGAGARGTAKPTLAAAQPTREHFTSTADALVPTLIETTPEHPSRKLVKLVADASSAGFISSANAQSLPAVAVSRQVQGSSAPTLERLWPYCAMLLCLGGLAMCFTVLRRQRSQRAPAWAATATHAFSKSAEHSHTSQNTFAHYTEMTEPAPVAARKPADRPEARRDAVASNGELDTLLNEDLIDEDAIRREWAAVASEQAMDIGTDSILKAIAVAEREMRIGSIPSAEVAIDKALDDELLLEPNKR